MIEDWAIRHGVSAAALAELRTLFIQVSDAAYVNGSESRVESELAVTAPKLDASLWRNNNGACQDETGRVIRYGLGNTSKKFGDVWKSSDRVGITPVKILPHHVGRTLGVFTSVEVKKPGWTKPTNDRERAQMNFAMNVASMGGFAMFCTDVSQYVVFVESVRK